MNIEELKAQLAIALADAGFLELREDEGISLNRYVCKPHAKMRGIDPFAGYGLGLRGGPSSRLRRGTMPILQM